MNRYISGKLKPEQTINKTKGRPTKEQKKLSDDKYITLSYPTPKKIIKNGIK